MFCFPSGAREKYHLLLISGNQLYLLFYQEISGLYIILLLIFVCDAYELVFLITSAKRLFFVIVLVIVYRHAHILYVILLEIVNFIDRIINREKSKQIREFQLTRISIG